jgi:glutamyl-tRNA synthetase
MFPQKSGFITDKGNILSDVQNVKKFPNISRKFSSAKIPDCNRIFATNFLQMSKPVRVRFAPSPTGPLHIGGVRTALFNYLFAKKHGGVFYLRIEDTDQNRYVPGAEEYIFEALEWLGIAPSESVGKNEKFGPYRQSERKDLYRQYADALISSGNAYYAFDTNEALDAHRKQHDEQGKTFIYNHHNRLKLDNSLVISAEETAKRIAAGEDYVIRFKTPVDETLHLHDIIRGDIKFETNLLDDKVLFKSDGMPTYHLANIVDDHLMETSHVIRGEEWLPSMPLHVLLYRSFGWEAPEFAHLPLILKPIGNGKLSKRDGDKLGFPVFPLEWQTEEGISSGYREKGYFPEAVVNFLALLGWNDGTDKELFSLEELVEAFDLNRVHKAGAKFDPEKNKWFNHQYLIRRDNTALAKDFVPVLDEKGVHVPFESVVKIVSLIKERAHFASEFWDLSDFFFIAPTAYDEKPAKSWNEETSETMSQLIDVLEDIRNFTSMEIETTVKEWLTAKGIGMGKVMQPFRLSVVGALKGPHLFDIVEMIGKEETTHRIKKAIANLS